MTHYDEQKNLIKHYFEEHFFSNWRLDDEKKDVSSAPLELIVSSVCNTKCSYCYYKNFDDKIYPKEIQHRQEIVENCEKLLKWMKLNNFHPRMVDIFSGEFFNLPYYKDILCLIDKYLTLPNSDNRLCVAIPTNCTFCFSEEKTNEIQSMLDEYNNNKHGIYVTLSMSIDGKLLDNDTRAMRNGKQYDDEYYHRAFEFAKRNGFGFHPMIAAKGIDRWIDNYEWYIENIVKHFDCTELDAMRMIYLLEVRNPDWTYEELDHLDKFITYYTKKAFKVCNEDVETFFNEFLIGKGSNLYSQYYGTIPRGLGCSIQSNFAVRLGDLSIPLCHRTSYDGFLAGHFKFDEENWDFEPENPNLYMLVNSFNSSNCPKCCDCPISEICNKFCIGCNYEVNKDFFIPVDTVCDLEFAKTTSIIRNLDEIGVINFMLNKAELVRANNLITKCEQIKELSKFIREQKNN